METQIGGGLIEEVIEVAEGELKLVNIMSQSQVYVSPHPAESVARDACVRMLTRTAGRTLRRSLRPVNGIIFQGISTLSPHKDLL